MLSGGTGAVSESAFFHAGCVRDNHEQEVEFTERHDFYVTQGRAAQGWVLDDCHLACDVGKGAGSTVQDVI